MKRRILYISVLILALVIVQASLVFSKDITGGNLAPGSDKEAISFTCDGNLSVVEILPARSQSSRTRIP